MWYILYMVEGILSMLFAEELAGGEFDGLVVAVDEVWGAGELNDRVMMASGDRDFLSEETGVRCDNGSANDIVVFVGEEFDEAVFEVVDLAGGDFGERDDGFAIFAALAEKILLV